jgi:uncharacterized protein involved in type VI secretion and phage assembly
MTGIGLLDTLMGGREQVKSDRVYGVAVGIVTNNQDPEELGRVRLRFPWLSDTDESHWARVMSPMAGPERGLYFLPEVDDEVLVMFEHGQLDYPFVIGALWNGKDKPPAQNKDGANNLRMLKSRSGHTVTFDDTDGAEKLVITDRTGKNTLILDSKENSITLSSDGELTVKAQGNLTLESSGGEVAIKCQTLSIDAQQSFAIKAGQDGKVEAQASLGLSCMAGVSVNDGALEVR